MHTNVILTSKRRTHAQSNYTNTKLNAWLRRLLRHPARKWSGPILHPPPPPDPQGRDMLYNNDENSTKYIHYMVTNEAMLRAL